MRVSATVCIAFLAVTTVVFPSMGQSPFALEQQIGELKARLGTEIQHLKSQNYQQASAEVIVTIERETAKRFPLALEGATTYAIVGACDSNCDRVQLSLMDGAGVVLVASPEKQAVVVIGGAPAVAGSYTLELAAPGCKERMCQAGFIVARYEIGGALPIGEGAFVAHVSSERSREDALGMYGRLKELAPAALASKEAMVELVDLGSRGIWHRLRIGPAMSESEALVLCGVMKAAGHNYCTAQLFESGTDAPRASPDDKASLGVRPGKAVRQRDPQGRPADVSKAAGESEPESQPTSGGRRCTNMESSCSAARRHCNRSCARRKRGGGCSNDCLQAFNLCMETGAWSTHYCSRTGLAQR